MSFNLYSTYASRAKNSLVALLFIAVQVAVPLSMPVMVNAAKPAGSDFDISSKGFVLTGNYSLVSGQPTGSGEIKNGNVGAYPEGACIPALFTVTNTGSTTQDTVLSPIYDYYKNGVIGITDYELISADNPVGSPANSVDNLNDLNFSGQSLSNVNGTTFTTSTGIPVTATVDGPYSGEDAGTTSVSSTDAARHYNITIEDVPANTSVYILLCGRLGQDASQYPGASLSLRTVQGGAENVPIPVNQLLVLPSITINKAITQGSAVASDFSFTVSPAVNGVSTYTIPTGQTSVVINNVNPDGSFTITESGPSGYRFTGGTGTACTVTASSIGTAAGQMVATVSAGRTPNNAVCSFTNTVNTGSITINKDALPNDVQDFSFTTTNLTPASFTLDDDSGVTGADITNSNQQVFSNLVPGSYSVTEAGTNGWDFTSLDCGSATGVTVTGATASINLAAGQNVTCTYTNTKKGHLIVSKATLPANENTTFSISATSSTGGTITGGGAGTINDSTNKTQDYEVTPGTYSVTETIPSGWALTTNGCLDQVVAAGQTVYCTITNTKLAQLQIVKDALPNRAQDFSFSTTGTGLTGFTLDDDSDNTLSNSQLFSNLNPGSYTIAEADLPDWDLTNLTCTGTTAYSRTNDTLNITLSAGDNVSCSFENTQRGSISGTKYEVNADGFVVTSSGGWTISLIQNGNVIATTTTSNTDGSFSFANLINGTYNLMETLQSGWTQIFSPGSVSLGIGEADSGNDFGNFRNGTINGFKFNDIDGDANFDAAEPKLNGWTITLYNDNNDADTLLNNVVTSQQTDLMGNYSFSNLAPDTYQVCETNQTGWVQTFPAASGCHVIVIDRSNETNQANFGNQGRGSITVIKNVDTNGDGTVDQIDATDWNWDIDGAGNFTTGSTNGQVVVAGTYTVSERQRTEYQATASSCTGETGNTISASQTVTVSAGEAVVCTFTNTNATPQLTVVKEVVNTAGNNKVSSDFTMFVEGTNVSDPDFPGDANGTLVTLDPGTYEVTETNLPGYTVSFSPECTGTIGYGQKVTCTVTNTADAPVLNLAKTNDQPEPTVTGDTVTYTLIVTVPEASGEVFNAVVTDLPPNNFEYIPGSWTAQSNERGDLKAEGVTTEPTYGSPGSWQLGNVLPGERIVLTYLARIGTAVTDGTYPDLAFVKGASAPLNGTTVLGNLSSAPTPFVATRVAVFTPSPAQVFTAGQVLGAEVLVNTGTAMLTAQYILPVLMIGIVFLARRMSYTQGKGDY